jgi:hypothetical protein
VTEVKELVEVGREIALVAASDDIGEESLLSVMECIALLLNHKVL